MSGQMTRLAARAHQDMLRREAPASSLPEIRMEERLQVWHRVLLGLGDLLITTGSRLRERYEPAVRCCGDSYPSAAGKAGA
ncbi:hypothetical protein ACFLWA_04825 [Chloroflexota bacterium]